MIRAGEKNEAGKKTRWYQKVIILDGIAREGIAEKAGVK